MNLRVYKFKPVDQSYYKRTSVTSHVSPEKVLSAEMHPIMSRNLRNDIEEEMKQSTAQQTETLISLLFAEYK